MLFPVKLDCAPVTIAVRKPRYKTVEVWWPVLRLSCWAAALLKEVPRVLLGGHSLEDTFGWQSTFQTFWQKYQRINPKHRIYADKLDWKLCVPYFIHGDEGRGLCRRQFLVTS